MLLGAREPSFRALAADGRAAALVSRLDPAAPLAARWDGDFAALGRKLVPIDRGAGPGRARSGAASTSSGTSSACSRRAAPSRCRSPPASRSGGLTADAARADPLAAFEFEALLPLRPGADAAAAAERLARAAGARRASGRPDDAGIARLHTPSGEIAWKVDPRAAARRRRGRAARADRRAPRAGSRATRQGGRPRRPPREAALAGGLGGVALDAPRLVAAVRALPDEAFGGGPSGFVMRSLVERVVEPAARLTAVSLRAELAEGALLFVARRRGARGEER